MGTHEIAQAAAEFIRASPATVTVSGATIKLAQPGRIFVIECLSEDRFLVSNDFPPTAGGFQVRVTSQPRVEVTRSELFARVREWARLYSAA